jgi:hypothetical protein
MNMVACGDTPAISVVIKLSSSECSTRRNALASASVSGSIEGPVSRMLGNFLSCSSVCGRPPLTTRAPCGSSLRMRRFLITLFLVFAASSALAMVGGAMPADPAIARHVVLIVGSRGTSCTGVVIARDLILTVAHCAQPGADYKWVSFDSAGQPTLNDIASVLRHPQFDLNAFLNHRATADVALFRSAKPLPSNFAPVAMMPPLTPATVGQKFLVAGYGLAVPGDGKSGGKVRAALLTTTGRPGTLQIRLVDPQTNNARPGLGACTGDSGAPVFDVTGPPNLIGLVSWSTAANNDAGCGGLTGVTPLTRYRAWILETAGKLGSPLR